VALAGSALAPPAGGYGGVEAYPEFVEKAAVLTWHLIRNHPMPDGNKRTASVCLLEFVERNGRNWRLHRRRRRTTPLLSLKVLPPAWYLGRSW